jgi:hypothetical protein
MRVALERGYLTLLCMNSRINLAADLAHGRDVWVKLAVAIISFILGITLYLYFLYSLCIKTKR